MTLGPLIFGKESGGLCFRATILAMKVFLTADHGGFELKEKIKSYLVGELKSVEGQKLEVTDLGATQLDPEDDYPDFIFPLAEKVAQAQINNSELKIDRGSLGLDSDLPLSGVSRELTLGIAICRSGGGEVIAANKVRSIHAVVSFSPAHARMTRLDNDANVLCLPADYVSPEVAEAIVKVWLSTGFSREPRHVRRLAKIAAYESL